jgi:hypothetical protein
LITIRSTKGNALGKPGQALFNDVEKEYKGKAVYLKPESYFEHSVGDADLVTLDDCTVVHQHRKDILTIQTTNKGNQHEIKIIVNLVWIIRDMDGEMIALEVIDRKDAKTVIEF